jgi:hypothetical protein
MRIGARKYPDTSNFHSADGSGATTGGGSAGDARRPPTCGVSGDSDSPGPLPDDFFFSGAGAGAGAGAGGGVSAAGAAGAGVCAKADVTGNEDALRRTPNDRSRVFLGVVVIGGTFAWGWASG